MTPSAAPASAGAATPPVAPAAAPGTAISGDPVANAPGGAPPPAGPSSGQSPHGTTPADPAQAEALATELSHDLMSPYCPGRTIATCPSPQARKLEAHILEQAQQGKSRVEIETALAARFPDIRGYIGRPEIIYGTALVALIAIIGLVLTARRWVRSGRREPTVDAGAPGVPASAIPTEPVAMRVPLTPGAVTGTPSRVEIDALDDALDRIDEF